MERVDAVIAGVNKAGTTSLFVSLSEHPDVVASAVKETRYFLPARWGAPLEPASVWDSYFAAHPDRPVRLEATPADPVEAGVAERGTEPCRGGRRGVLHGVGGQPDRSVATLDTILGV